VQTEHSATAVMRRVGFFALLGFGVLILSGPIVAVVSVVASFALVVLGFALVGFVVWLPFFMLGHGPRAAGEKVRDVAVVVGRGCGWFCRTAGRVVAFPPRAGARLWAATKHGAWFAARKSVTTVRVLGEVGLVTAFGAGVGALVGLTRGSQMEHAVPINALAGGAIAAVAALVMMIRPRRCPRQA